MSINVLQYESKIWDTANLLLGAGIKQSNFSKFMMPFFALIMLESRLIRHLTGLEQELSRANIEAFLEEFQDYDIGYNDFVIREGITLQGICKNDKNFANTFELYLKAFDRQTRNLLGVDKDTEEEKFWDISGIAGQLKAKRILFDTVKKWSERQMMCKSTSTTKSASSRLPIPRPLPRAKPAFSAKTRPPTPRSTSTTFCASSKSATNRKKLSRPSSKPSKPKSTSYLLSSASTATAGASSPKCKAPAPASIPKKSTTTLPRCTASLCAATPTQASFSCAKPSLSSPSFATILKSRL